MKAGYDFIIRKELNGEYPKYDRSGFARQQSPAGESSDFEKWAANLHDLTTLRNPKGIDVLEKELAIHRGLIPDDTASTFNEDDFDAKWKKQAQDEVNELMEHNPGGVSVPAGVPVANTASVQVAETSTAVEDAPIEDEDFLRELEDMEG